MSEPGDRRDDVAGREEPLGDVRYFDFHDRAARLSGFVRIATDLVAQEALTSFCVWLPDGRTALATQWARSQAAADVVRTGGTRVRVNDPAEDVDVIHDGRVRVLEDPGELEAPVEPVEGAVAPAAPSTESETRLKYTFGSAEYDHVDRPGCRSQLAVIEGSVRLGDYTWEVDARGLLSVERTIERPAVPRAGRTLTAALDDGFGFGATETVSDDGAVGIDGFVWEGTSLHPVIGMVLETDYDVRHQPARVTAVLAGGDGRTWRVEGRVQRAAPIERSTAVRCIAGLIDWESDHGRSGPGTVHYTDPT